MVILMGKEGRGHPNHMKGAELGKSSHSLDLKSIRCLCSANELRVEMPPSQTGKGNSVGCCVGADLGNRSFCWLRLELD